MHIVFVNKYLYRKGGSETHLFGLADALQQQGHIISYFGGQDCRNETPPDRTTTVPLADYTQLRGWFERIRTFRDILYSTSALDCIRTQIELARPDLAHLHNIYHQLSPSVLVALHRAGVPCVLTAHDYKLVCPSYSLHDGRSECFACRGHGYWNVVARGCSRRGFAGDVALMAEAYTHHFSRIYKKYLQAIIAPSRFVRDRLVEGGYSPARVHVLPNAVPVKNFEPRSDPGTYFLFVGRLSYEKGLPTLIKAARLVPDAALWLAGDGPIRDQLVQQASDLPNVRFLGNQPPQEVKRLLQGCRALILPSEVPENCPLSVLEAFATAKPVVATRVGGVPELFEGETVGVIVPPRNPGALAEAMRRLGDCPDLCRQYGTAARRRAESLYDQAHYIRQLERLYRSLVHGKNPECEPEPRPPIFLPSHSWLKTDGTHPSPGVCLP